MEGEGAEGQRLQQDIRAAATRGQCVTCFLMRHPRPLGAPKIDESAAALDTGLDCFGQGDAALHSPEDTNV